VKVIALVLRYFSCLYALMLGVFLAGMSLVLLISGSTNFKFDMLPFLKGDGLLYTLLGLGVVSVAAAALALFGKLRALLVIATATLVSLLIYGFFINKGYRFPGKAEALNVAYVTLAGVVAFVGSLAQFRPGSSKRA
jgi:hypothetical protein